MAKSGCWTRTHRKKSPDRNGDGGRLRLDKTFQSPVVSLTEDGCDRAVSAGEVALRRWFAKGLDFYEIECCPTCGAFFLNKVFTTVFFEAYYPSRFSSVRLSRTR